MLPPCTFINQMGERIKITSTSNVNGKVNRKLIAKSDSKNDGKILIDTGEVSKSRSYDRRNCR